jgi:hypothetical protein
VRWPLLSYTGAETDKCSDVPRKWFYKVVTLTIDLIAAWWEKRRRTGFTYFSWGRAGFRYLLSIRLWRAFVTLGAGHVGKIGHSRQPHEPVQSLFSVHPDNSRASTVESLGNSCRIHQPRSSDSYLHRYSTGSAYLTAFLKLLELVIRQLISSLPSTT